MLHELKQRPDCLIIIIHVYTILCLFLKYHFVVDQGLSGGVIYVNCGDWCSVTGTWFDVGQVMLTDVTGTETETRLFDYYRTMYYVLCRLVFCHSDMICSWTETNVNGTGTGTNCFIIIVLCVMGRLVFCHSNMICSWTETNVTETEASCFIIIVF